MRVPLCKAAVPSWLCLWLETDTISAATTVPCILITQHFGHPHAAVDILRVVRLAAYGLLIDGPIGSMWYDVLEQYVFPKEPVSTKAVLAKTALDQVIYATIMTGEDLVQVHDW